MKKLISLISLSLVLMLSLGCLSGCHKKDEIALTVDGVEIKTATYICALIDADLQARQNVYNEKSEEEGFSSSTVIDYFSETIDGKEYSVWVKDTAITLLKKYAWSKKLLADGKASFTDKEESNIESNASYYWSNNGGAYLYSNNGVSFNSYLDYYRTSMVVGSYFLSIYGKEGTDPVPEEEVSKIFYDNYDISHYLYFSSVGTDNKTKDDEVIEKAKKTLEEYAANINSGKYTFKDAETLWNLYNGTTTDKKDDDKDNTSSDTSSAATSSSASSSGSVEEEEEEKPLDSTATLIASADSGSSYASSYFEKIHALGVNKATVVKDDNNNYYLFERGDIKGDPYYFNAEYNNALAMIKYEDFLESYEADASKLTYTENTFATGIISPKTIDYEQYNTFINYYNYSGSTAN